MPQPNLDPQMYQELMQQEQQEMPQQQAQQMQQAQMQPPQQEMQPQRQVPPQEEDLESVKSMLGIDEAQKQLEQMREKMAAIEADKAKAEVSAKYPDVPYELVEKEIEKVRAINPDLADAMLINPDAMEMAYKAVKAELKPQEEPDKLLEGEGGGAGEKDDLTKRIEEGKADDYDLGGYIAGYAKE